LDLLRPPLRKWAILIALLAALMAIHPLLLPAVGRALVQAEEPAPADAALVLGGDGFGYRILKGAELVREKHTGVVLVSGPDGVYGYNEAELAIRFAVRAGYPESWFVALPHSARSTAAEAAVLAPELRKRGIRTCLLVTSNFHTRRAGRTFRAVIPDIQFRVVAAGYPGFEPDSWWREREGRKTVLLEWQKTIASWVGM